MRLTGVSFAWCRPILLHQRIDLDDVGLSDGAEGAAAIGDVVAQSEGGVNGQQAVARGMATAGEWTRLAVLDVSACAM